MDLYHHPNPPFTIWAIKNRCLREKLVVIDIGCQGGMHPRWAFLGECLEFHGFDAITEVVAQLRKNDKAGHTYHELALGNEDGEREFFVPDNTFSASFYQDGSVPQETTAGTIARGVRKVSIRRLDTLFKEGKLPPSDYIKLDCEGFEPEILRGARHYLASSGNICVTSESNFNISPVLPYTHFQALNEILVEHRLLVFDLNLVRAPRVSYGLARARHPLPPPDPVLGWPDLDVGPPTTIDVVFCRDFVAEAREPQSYVVSKVPTGPPSVDQLIKAMINFELHGLMDCAYDIAVQFRDRLQSRFDVEKACELLRQRAPVPRNTKDVINCLEMVSQVRSRLNPKRSRRTFWSRLTR
jgi:FkbM family methyltransferase